LGAVSRLLARVACVLGVVVLAGCRVDVAVDLVIGADGTGEVVVTATADAEVAERAPGLAEDLRLDDATAAGWTVEGPNPTDDGGLSVTLRHPVTSAAEATNLLASLGPPFTDVRVERTTVGDETTVTLSGRLNLANGFASFADSELLASAGGAPFADELDGLTPAETMSVVLRADLPGEVDETTGERREGALEWDAPLDGLAVELATTTVQRPATGGSWARPLSVLVLVLLLGWLVAAGAFMLSVARVRRRRRARRPL
jgi:hypothetical protein